MIATVPNACAGPWLHVKVHSCEFEDMRFEEKTFLGTQGKVLACWLVFPSLGYAVH